jgi:alkylation response protein AidB-like acyl-CoA dehydrogenase
MILKEEEIRKLKEVERFSKEKVRLRASEIDRLGEFPNDLINDMISMGLFSMYIPTKYGGMGYSLSSLMEAVRIISRECASTSLILDVTVSLFAEPIIQFGSEFLKENYLGKVARGEIGALAITEPGTGSDAAAIKTIAKKENGKYRINGTKTFITNGKEARFYLVSAMTDPMKKHKGMTLFVVDRDNPGLSIGNEFRKMGVRGSSTTEVILNNVEVGEEYILGKEGEGFKIEMETLNVGRIGIASQAVGISEGAFNDMRNYAMENQENIREWFLFRMADIASDLQSSIKNLEEAIAYSESGKNSPLLSSISKLTAGDSAVSITSRVLSLLGINSLSEEYPVERRFREAKITQIYEGTNEIQRLIIGKELLKGRDFKD